MKLYRPTVKPPRPIKAVRRGRTVTESRMLVSHMVDGSLSTKLNGLGCSKRSTTWQWRPSIQQEYGLLNHQLTFA